MKRLPGSDFRSTGGRGVSTTGGSTTGAGLRSEAGAYAVVWAPANRLPPMISEEMISEEMISEEISGKMISEHLGMELMVACETGAKADRSLNPVLSSRPSFSLPITALIEYCSISQASACSAAFLSGLRGSSFSLQVSPQDKPDPLQISASDSSRISTLPT
jgi:hypothetical protein